MNKLVKVEMIGCMVLFLRQHIAKYVTSYKQ